MGRNSVLFVGAMVLMVVAFVNVKGEGAVGGGTSEAETPADENVKSLVEKLTSSITAKIGEKNGANSSPTKFEAISYKTQVVSGTNYFVKARGMSDDGTVLGIYHIRIYEQTWTDKLEVSAVCGPKEEKDALKYF